MSVSILIGTFGEQSWAEAAWSHAYPSANDADEVLVRHLPEGTLAQVRNRLAAEATSDWLCFLDADDDLAHGYVDAMTEVFTTLDDEFWLLAPAVSYVRHDLVIPGMRVQGLPAIPNKGRWPDMNECVIGTLVARELFLEVGGFRELPSLEDYDLWLRCVKAGARIVHVPGAVYQATVRDRSRNSDQSVYHELRREHAAVWRNR